MNAFLDAGFAHCFRLFQLCDVLIHFKLMLQSCIKVALDFVSPENVNQCVALTDQFRLLPTNHRAKEDKLEVKLLSYT